MDGLPRCRVAVCHFPDTPNVNYGAANELDLLPLNYDHIKNPQDLSFVSEITVKKLKFFFICADNTVKSAGR